MSGRFRKRGHAPQTVLTQEDVAYLERNTRSVAISNQDNDECDEYFRYNEEDIREWFR